MVVSICIPYLRGRGKFFAEARRSFTRSFSSSVIDGYKYDPELDIVLNLCALTFHCHVANYPNFGAWYNQTNHAIVRFHEDTGNRPVFINSSTREENVPWTTSSANHTVTKRMRSSGLNRKSFNFRK
ncbi:hypothetical protein BDF21DRAFT_467423 [Thamnidium elegans]|nr:hypothetical protein BDF21DRAFT_467423 [Thamnidium elegans]